MQVVYELYILVTRCDNDKKFSMTSQKSFSFWSKQKNLKWTLTKKFGTKKIGKKRKKRKRKTSIHNWEWIGKEKMKRSSHKQIVSLGYFF